MIITRAPFRISLAGGGSDLPSFYRKWGGAVLSTSINKYIYINIHPFFEENRIQLKYSQTENVDHPGLVKHRIFGAVLNRFNLTGVEITSTADIPSGTGLGSSSSFTVALLQSVYAYLGKYRSKAELAAEACAIELDELKSPIGKQDQYAAAFGGLNFIRFHPDDSVVVEPITIHHDRLQDLNSRWLMFYTGITRDANDILTEQTRAVESESAAVKAVQRLSELAECMQRVLQSGDIADIGPLLDEGWCVKRSIASGISSSGIDDLYQLARSAGATGGKLLGAGGGGFMLLFCDPGQREALRKKLASLKELPFHTESGGVQIVYYEG